MTSNDTSPTATLSYSQQSFSVPSRPGKNKSTNHSPTTSSHDLASSASAALSPGGPVPQGYSYLNRSHSLATSSRSRPRGLQSDQRHLSQPAPSTVSDTKASARQPQTIPTSASADGFATPNTATPIRRSNTVAAFPRDVSPSTRPEPETLAALVARLPPNPKQWTPSQVALYLSHVLGLTPRPIVEDVTNYVRSSRMGGRAFLRLREQDLIQEGLNTRWRGLMLDAVRKLRRNCLRGRIWGFGTEPSAWSGDGEQDDEPDAADIDEYPAEDEVPPVAKTSTTSKDTLRKIRERRRIRGMIQAFETASENGNEDDDDGFVALGHRHRLSGSGSGSGSGGSEARPSLPPIYGPGFVKERAASFTSLSDADEDSPANTPNRPLRLRFDAEELEEWFGTMSEQEAAALASELEEDELLGYDDNDVEEESFDHLRHSASEGVPAQQQESHVSTVTSISEHHERASSSEDAIAPKADETTMGDEMTRTLKRDPATARAIKTSPYRASTYSPEALALLPEEGLPRFGTARRIPSGGTPGAMSLPDAIATVVGSSELSAAELSALLDSHERHEAPVPAPEQAPEHSFSVHEDEDEIVELPATLSSPATLEHMRNMSSHAAAGVSPYGALSRKQSQKRRSVAGAGLTREAEQNQEPRTLGRDRGSSLSALLSEAFPPGIDEGGDGGGAGAAPKTPPRTLSKASRLGLPSGRSPHGAKSADSEAAAPASVLLDLFGPLKPREDSSEEMQSAKMDLEAIEAPAPSTSNDGPTEDATLLAAHVIAEATAAAEAAEASGTGEQIALPLTTLEPTLDGKGSIKRRSMVLVDRARFESLARRMGALENQLSNVEEANGGLTEGADSVATRGSYGTSGRNKAILAEMFNAQEDGAVHDANVLSSADVVRSREDSGAKGDEVQQRRAHLDDDDEEQSASWSFPFGAIPSYMLGLGAGIGFVVLSEVVGRAARMRT